MYVHQKPYVLLALLSNHAAWQESFPRSSYLLVFDAKALAFLGCLERPPFLFWVLHTVSHKRDLELLGWKRDHW